VACSRAKLMIMMMIIILIMQNEQATYMLVDLAISWIKI
jgi:hypothetical protein